MPPPPPTPPTKRPPLKPLQPASSSSPTTKFLILYNSLSFLLWLIIFVRVIALLPLVGWERVYDGTGQWVKWVQTSMSIEVVFALAGLIPSPLPTILMQISSRLLLVWFIVDRFPILAVSPAYSVMLIAWSLTEVIRYSYLALSLSGTKIRTWTRLRYSAFLALYPAGIGSECLLIWAAVPLAAEVGWFYAWFLKGVLVGYVPGSYILFTYMLKQRKKVLRGLQARRD